MKRWLWSLNARGGGQGGETRHFVAPGETLKAVAGKYSVDIPTLLGWNKSRIKGAEDVYPGMSLVVGFVQRGGVDEDVEAAPHDAGR